MCVDNSAARKNKGLAWNWLKNQIAERLGADEADTLLGGYYALLHEEYKDRARLAAAKEIEQFEKDLEIARKAQRQADVRRILTKIEVRKQRLTW